MPANKDNPALGGLVTPSLVATRGANLTGVTTVNSDNLRNHDYDCDNCEADNLQQFGSKYVTE